MCHSPVGTLARHEAGGTLHRVGTFGKRFSNITIRKIPRRSSLTYDTVTEGVGSECGITGLRDVVIVANCIANLATLQF